MNSNTLAGAGNTGAYLAQGAGGAADRRGAEMFAEAKDQAEEAPVLPKKGPLKFKVVGASKVDTILGKLRSTTPELG